MAPLRAERSARRDLLHGVLLTLPWASVAVLWARVLRPHGAVVLGRPGMFVALCVVVTVAVTAAWIAHNISIHKTKGPRRGVPAAALDYGRDWVGRPVVADWTAVRHAGIVFVAGADRHKTFVPARANGCRPLPDRSARPVPAGPRAPVAAAR